MTKVHRKQGKELRAVAALRDTQIDFSVAAEVRDSSHAVVGSFYRPIKKSVTIRLDADVLTWLKAQGRRLKRGGYEATDSRRRSCSSPPMTMRQSSA